MGEAATGFARRAHAAGHAIGVPHFIQTLSSACRQSAPAQWHPRSSGFSNSHSRIQRLCGDFHLIDRRTRFRNGLADLTHGIEVRDHGVLKIPSRLFLRVADGHASGNVRRVGRIACPSLFYDYRIASRAHFSPAFLSIAFKVPGASSLPSLPPARLPRKLDLDA